MAMSTLGLAVSLVWSVPSAFAAGAANAQADEVVRLINGERAALGEAPVAVDSYLATKARDGAVACPNDASLVVDGRAKDFAVYGFPKNAHLLRLCPAYTSLDAMKAWGYNGGRGEVVAVNGGFGTSMVDYAYGCTPTVRTCPGSTTSTYYTTARVVTDWTSSPSHYDILIGAYDRVGCGAWIGADGAYYYDCMFSAGGRVVPRSPSTPRPPSTPQPPRATRAPVAPKAATATKPPAVTPSPVAASPTPGPTLSPTDNPSAPPTAATTEASSTAAPSPTAIVEGVQMTNPAPTVAPGAGTTAGGPQADSPGRASVPAAARDLGVAAGAMTAIASLLWALLLTFRQRRREDRSAG
jgi:hypothetical protein